MTKDPGAPAPADDTLLDVVGVVRDAKYLTLREETPPTLFHPRVDAGMETFAVRTAARPLSLVPSIREALKGTSAGFVASQFRTQEDQTALTFAEERHFATLSTLFGALALALTGIGLYGLFSYRVARRTREIGVRMALGAGRARVMGGVLRDVLVIAGLGMALGLTAAATTARLLQSLLFGVAPLDPITLAGAALVMTVVAVLAGLLPARRAAGVDPVVALRAQ